jgi:hypothetical protein
MCAILLQICAHSDKFVQGNCQVCTGMKDKLDYLEDHEPEQLEELQALIQGARRHSKYPGWNLNPDCSVLPRKKAERIMEESRKVLNNSAVKAATSVLEFHLEDNQTWLLPHFFCNIQVQMCTYIHTCAFWNVHILTQM